MTTVWHDKRKLLKISIIVLIGLAIVGYAFFQSRNLIEGPQIVITSPSNGATFSDPRVTVSGTAKNISFLTLNDRQIFMNAEGVWSEELLLSPGDNVWTIEAKDKFGRSTVKKLELVFRKS